MTFYWSSAKTFRSVLINEHFIIIVFILRFVLKGQFHPPVLLVILGLGQQMKPNIRTSRVPNPHDARVHLTHLPAFKPFNTT